MLAMPPNATDAAYGQSSLVTAVEWMEQLITGRVATLVAVIAIGLIGFRMLTGELPARTALRVIIGCFILFGAPVIVRGLIGAVRPATGDYISPTAPLNVAPMPPVTNPPAATIGGNPFDPYSGSGGADR